MGVWMGGSQYPQQEKEEEEKTRKDQKGGSRQEMEYKKEHLKVLI